MCVCTICVSCVAYGSDSVLILIKDHLMLSGAMSLLTLQGSIAFFHPFAECGGGGERVLWAAIECLQKSYPGWAIYVYCDQSCDAESLSKHAISRFNVDITGSFHVIPLRKRHLLSPSRYPRFTMICQAVASLVVSVEALYQFVPEIWVDTTGWAFVYPLLRILGCKVVAYVHYPTISSDMLLRVQRRETAFNNSQTLTSNSIFSYLKLIYYQMFGYWYGFCGGFANICMVNSSWTRDHVGNIWWLGRPQQPILVYPPCDTVALQEAPLDRHPSVCTIVSVAQFRPEKNHEIQLYAFAHARKIARNLSDQDLCKTILETKLLMIGGCRDDGDYQRVEMLKAKALEIGLDDGCIEFHVNVPFENLQVMVGNAVAGIHSMKDEHFGISVVEYMAAGAIPIAHNSAGPKGDIVRAEDIDGVMQPTGFLCETMEEYADAIISVLQMNDIERMNMRRAARIRSNRFSQKHFQQGWLDAMEPVLVNLPKAKKRE